MPEFKTKEEYLEWKSQQQSRINSTKEETLSSALNKGSSQKDNFYTRWGHWVIIGTVLAAVLWGVLSSGKPALTFYIGDQVHIKAAPSKMAIIPVSESAFEELGRMADANDKIGVTKLLVGGDAFIVDDGVLALVLEIRPNLASSHATKIRILEGSKSGREGWIYTSFLYK